MYPPGHVGIALALYAPIGLVLLVRGRSRLALAGTFLVAGLTLLPDVDKWLPWVVHRGRTHTLWFALGVGGSLGAALATIGEYRAERSTLGLAAFGVVVGTLAVLAHLLGDVITPLGVRPLQPVSAVSYTFSLVFASDPTANAWLFALGVLATVAQLGLGVGFGPAATRRRIRGAVGRYVPNGLHDVRVSTEAATWGLDRRVSSPRRVRETDD